MRFLEKLLPVSALILVAALPAMAEGHGGSPENTSLILALGGGAVITWQYVRGRLRR